MIRYNSSGEYNVPFERYPNLNTQLVTAQHSQLLRGADLYSLDYKRIFDMVGEDDFMFLDPPYDCVFKASERLSLDITKPGAGLLPFDKKRVLTLEGATKATWAMNEVYDTQHIYGKRKNGAKDPIKGLYYAGIWHTLLYTQDKEKVGNIATMGNGIVAFITSVHDQNGRLCKFAPINQRQQLSLFVPPHSAIHKNRIVYVVNDICVQGIVPTRVRGRYDKTVGVWITKDRQFCSVYRPQVVFAMKPLPSQAVTATIEVLPHFIKGAWRNSLAPLR